MTAALAEARPGKVVCLSTIGADAPHENLLTQRTLMEQLLEEIGLPVTFLRPGWFMENALWDVPAARDEGVLRSFLQPADKTFPMVATQDVGRLAAALLRSQSTQNPLPRIRMLDGFNEGWIEFSDHGRSAMKGTTALESVIAELVRAS